MFSFLGGEGQGTSLHKPAKCIIPREGGARHNWGLPVVSLVRQARCSHSTHPFMLYSYCARGDLDPPGTADIVGGGVSDIVIVGFLLSSTPLPLLIAFARRPSPVVRCPTPTYTHRAACRSCPRSPIFSFYFRSYCGQFALTGQRRASGRLAVGRYPNFLPSVGQRGGLGN